MESKGWILDTADEGITKVVILLQTCKSVLASSNINVLIFSCFFRVIFIYLKMQRFQERILVFLAIPKRGVYFPQISG